MKPKEYLVSIGALPPGAENARGRLSAANITLCEKGAAGGVHIDGYAVTHHAQEASTVERVKVTNEKTVEEIAPYRYDFDTHKVFEWRNGKRVERSLKEACNNCRVSLVQCHCGSPRIVAHDGNGAVSVSIEEAS